MMRHIKLIFLLTILIGSTIGCQKQNQVINNEPNHYTLTKDLDNYDSFIKALPASDFYAKVDIGLDYPVLLVTDEVYDNLDGNDKVTIYATVYYIIDSQLQKIGDLESGGTAYPIYSDSDAFYVAGNNFAEKVIMDDQKKELVVKESVNVQYEQDTGNPKYLAMCDGKDAEATEEEFYRFFDYQKTAKIVNFTNEK